MTAARRSPLIMVAPNGARRTRADHPAIPITPEEVAATALACRQAGADAIHAHIRDGDGQHILDAGIYRRLLDLLARTVPGMPVQITTEAVGRYRPAEQMALVRALRPRAVSAALREIIPTGADETEGADFYRWCADTGVEVQHILYDPSEVKRLGTLVRRGIVPSENLSVIYVLGRYTVDQESRPEDLLPFLAAAADLPVRPEWMVCAFGRGETACLEAAMRAGGNVRVGFENSLWDADGRLAPSNEARVAAIRRIADRIVGESAA